MATQLSPASPRIARAGQVILGLLWLTDGALQFQPYMFGRTFITGVILPSAAGQPGIIRAPITWIARLIEPQVGVFNACAATLQVLIGLGLIHRRAVKLSLFVSFAWAGGIWFAGEGLGMIFTGTASPLTGAPGAAALYIVAGLMCWPVGGAAASRRVYGAARWCWSAIWVGSALLWVLPHTDTASGGTSVAAGLAAVSAAIGVSFLRGWHTKLFLVLAIVLSLWLWILGQDFGDVLSGHATDVGTAPVMVLIAAILLAWEHTQRLAARSRMIAVPGEPPAAHDDSSSAANGRRPGYRRSPSCRRGLPLGSDGDRSRRSNGRPGWATTLTQVVAGVIIRAHGGGRRGLRQRPPIDAGLL